MYSKNCVLLPPLLAHNTVAKMFTTVSQTTAGSELVLRKWQVAKQFFNIEKNCEAILRKIAKQFSRSCKADHSLEFLRHSPEVSLTFK